MTLDCRTGGHMCLCARPVTHSGSRCDPTSLAHSPGKTRLRPYSESGLTVCRAPAPRWPARAHPPALTHPPLPTAPSHMWVFFVFHDHTETLMSTLRRHHDANASPAAAHPCPAPAPPTAGPPPCPPSCSCAASRRRRRRGGASRCSGSWKRSGRGMRGPSCCSPPRPRLRPTSRGAGSAWPESGRLWRGGGRRRLRHGASGESQARIGCHRCPFIG